MAERRRNCADKLRAEMVMKKIHRRKRLDPAMAIFIQMLGLASILINVFPCSRRVSIALPEPECPQPVLQPIREAASRSYKYAPSWPRIVSDLARPVARSTARVELYARLPLECHPWLDEVVKNEDWALLRQFARSGASDETAGSAAVAAFRRWKADRVEGEREVEAAADVGSGGAAAWPSPGPK